MGKLLRLVWSPVCCLCYWNSVHKASPCLKLRSFELAFAHGGQHSCLSLLCPDAIFSVPFIAETVLIQCVFCFLYLLLVSLLWRNSWWKPLSREGFTVAPSLRVVVVWVRRTPKGSCLNTWSLNDHENMTSLGKVEEADFTVDMRENSRRHLQGSRLNQAMKEGKEEQEGRET